MLDAIPECKAEEAVVGEVVLVKKGERAKVLAIVGKEGFASAFSMMAGRPIVSESPEPVDLAYLRELYGQLEIAGARGFRKPTDEEMVAMYENGKKKRWIEVEFETPCDDGSPRTGLFSTFRRVS
jgi:hypothetical protein